MTCKRLKDKVDRYFVILLGFCSQEKEKDKTAERSINDIGRVEYSWNEGKCVRMWGKYNKQGGSQKQVNDKMEGFYKNQLFFKSTHTIQFYTKYINSFVQVKIKLL